ncbi:hypothetical protein OWM54_21770 [Myxococcus sp. MISCRS1]|uniref:hypothetical protein n=1 Tax=Myxococcus TaxID=32 RepID=UPI001CBD2594|nr:MULTISPECIES: hypothetical protein [unclassified Myxococcus]MBZ4399275.1 hypothetical protein [Myxococcus sp. AS-1-15]MCY0999769.1 hypothetical protein [Myxococcus sp. MISCRS1]BDT30457.1 hypothetical protein MFMH1_01260 [Myxococcus sp. MH1]
MRIPLSPTLVRTLEQPRVDVTPAPGAAASGTGTAAAPEVTPVEAPTDAYGAQEAQLSEWVQRFGALASAVGTASATQPQQVACVSDLSSMKVPQLGGPADGASVLQQTKDSNCGSAVAVMLGKDKGTTGAKPSTETMDSLESRFTNGDGTTPHELSNMIAHEGAAVTQASGSFDKKLMDEALARDGKAAVLVDSNKVDPNAKDAGKGRAHWVTVDGKDAQGNYTVKDPGTGKSVKMDAGALEDAVGTAWSEHNGGGMLVVEKAEGTTEAERAQRGGEIATALGNSDGGGSRRGAFARESS